MDATAPATYLGTAVPDDIAAAWRTWEGAAWRKGAWLSANRLNPPDERFHVRAPGGMCKRHLEMRLGYRNQYFDPRSGNRWPGTPGSPFTIIRKLDEELAWRRAEWDEKAGEQMRLIEECCLRGTSPQCSEGRTCLGCGLFTCKCPED